MSHFASIKTQIKDLNALMAALKSFGFEPEHHTVAQPLYGYMGDKRKQVANVIVRRSQIGDASNDLGFLWDDQTETFETIISDWDRSVGMAKAGQGLGSNFVPRLMAEYAKQTVLLKAEELGHEATVTERIVNGQFMGYTIKVDTGSSMLAGQSTLSSNRLHIGG